MTPRSEYPRPQFKREEWLCLNGPWQFETDAGDSGEERGLAGRELQGAIQVPFCPESQLSGVADTDYLNAVWYRRVVRVPEPWRGRRVLLHFQAVDDEATVWVDGKRVAWHRGGWTPFHADLGDAGGREVLIVLRARDNHREPKAQGKQSVAYRNRGCRYTRTTGVWQSVWMEPVSALALARPRIVPDLGRETFRVTLPLDFGLPRPSTEGVRARAELSADGRRLARVETAVRDLAPTLDLRIPSDAVRPWAPENPFLYDLRFELLDANGTPMDSVASYAGLRSVRLDGRRVRINGRPVFQRLVLDQGYYPDGIMTAPDDETLRRDIELSLAAGFNGARLHQKVFEERFLYHADRLGYLVWAEYGDWGLADDARFEDVVTGWTEAMQRDVSHPCIVGWCPLNEQWRFTNPDVERRAGLMRALYTVTKAVDPSRPALDVSGGLHCVPESDVLDNHDYDQNPATFEENYEKLGGEDTLREWWTKPALPPTIGGRPFFVSEFGGIWWNPGAKMGENSWGYGERPRTEEEFYRRFERLCAALLSNPGIFGYCYTQLTDVFQEQNGIYRFDRTPKFDLKRIRSAQARRAAIEGE